MVVFPLGIFRRAQRPAHFSGSLNVLCSFFWCPKCTLPIFSGNTCTAHFTAKVKGSCFHFPFKTPSWVFSPPPSPPPAARHLHKVKDLGPGVQKWRLQLVAPHKWKHISSDDLFLCKCLNSRFSTNCILQYASFIKSIAHCWDTKK